MFRFALIGVAAAIPSWEAYKQQFGKVYNGAEDDAKNAQFVTNARLIEEHNVNHEGGLRLGYNQFTDLTQDEYRVAAGLGYKPAAARHAGLPHLGVHKYNGEELAATVDWSTQGAVTPVKDQGQCGSCWAFSSTGGMEGAWQISSSKLVSMSEQQLVDCARNDYMAGCNGGDMGAAFDWAKTQNIATEASYPYKGVDGTCQTSFSAAIPEGGVTGYMSVDQSTAALKSAIQKGPVSVAIEADQLAFQLYSGGILEDTGGFFGSCGQNLDHGVLAVGYGDGYFKVKNSWGASWGESGYLQISDAGNTCGIHSDATYPTVSASVSSEVPEFVTYPTYPPDICVPEGACVRSTVYLGSDCCESAHKYPSGGCTSGEVCKQHDCVPDGGCPTTGLEGASYECCTGSWHDTHLFDHPWCSYGMVCGKKDESVSV